jgi:hypothetical protein
MMEASMTPEKEVLGRLIVRHVELYAQSKKKDFHSYYDIDLRNLHKLADVDVRNFFRSIKVGGIRDCEDGYLALARPGCRLRMFDHGLRGAKQTAKVSVEPILSIGVVARLVETFGWPAQAIGTQMDKGAFDLSIYSGFSSVPAVQCEIKVRATEVDAMAAYFLSVLNSAKPPEERHKNWNRKLGSIVAQPPKLVWLLAPGQYERVFRVDATNSKLTMLEVEAKELRFADFGQLADH